MLIRKITVAGKEFPGNDWRRGLREYIDGVLCGTSYVLANPVLGFNDTFIERLPEQDSEQDSRYILYGETVTAPSVPRSKFREIPGAIFDCDGAQGYKFEHTLLRFLYNDARLLLTVAFPGPKDSEHGDNLFLWKDEQALCVAAVNSKYFFSPTRDLTHVRIPENSRDAKTRYGL